MPERIQLSRKKGWRKPENTVVVARRSKWGNPVRIVPVHAHGPFDLECDGVGFIGQHTDMEGARRSAVARFRDLVLHYRGLAPSVVEIRARSPGRTSRAGARWITRATRTSSSTSRTERTDAGARHERA